MPNLRSRNIDAAVVYSPLSFQLEQSGQARILLDFSEAIPVHLATVWITTQTVIERDPAMIQKGLNALYGAVRWMHEDRDPAIALITGFGDVPASTTYQPAMQGLEHFLDEIGQRGFTLQRDFPLTAVPIESGQVTADLSGLITPE